MGSKKNPGSYDCYNMAEDGEETFTLLARDPQFAAVIEFWVSKRLLAGQNSLNDDQIIEARKCAIRGKQWRKANR